MKKIWLLFMVSLFLVSCNQDKNDCDEIQESIIYNSFDSSSIVDIETCTISKSSTNYNEDKIINYFYSIVIERNQSWQTTRYLLLCNDYFNEEEANKIWFSYINWYICDISKKITK